jgi:uncharacterized membrane protein YeaQ/YmgE (transglycosylase-associated protein family)
MMGLMGLAAGWIANTLLGRSSDLIGSLVPGVLGAYVGGYIQQYAQLDLMKIGNPLLEQLAVAVIGAVVVILVARSVVGHPSHR